LEGYQPGGVTIVRRGKKFHEIIAPLFAKPKCRGVESGLRRARKNTKMAARALYNNPGNPTAFSTLNKLVAALPKKNKSHVRAWLEHQDTYTMQRLVRKWSLRNPYTLTNLMDVWECNLLD
jgi:hypothetical protein